jgi:hypothetical protein
LIYKGKLEIEKMLLQQKIEKKLQSSAAFKRKGSKRAAESAKKSVQDQVQH